MMTSSNGNIFRVTGPLCGEFTGPGEFPTQRPVTRSFDVFFDRRLNKRLSKQPRGWWLETLSCSLWRQSNGLSFSLNIWTIGFASCHHWQLKPGYKSSYSVGLTLRFELSIRLHVSIIRDKWHIYGVVLFLTHCSLLASNGDTNMG